MFLASADGKDQWHYVMTPWELWELEWRGIGLSVIGVGVTAMLHQIFMHRVKPPAKWLIISTLLLILNLIAASLLLWRLYENGGKKDTTNDLGIGALCMHPRHVINLLLGLICFLGGMAMNAAILAPDQWWS